MEGFNNIYKDKTILVTGHTGFKGSWLSIWLSELGSKVIGYGLTPNTMKDNFVLTKLSEKIIDIRGDIRDFEKLKRVFEKYKPSVVFHLAAQSLVKESYKNPKETYETNVMGTLNILECIRQVESVKVGILVTSDKCYENKEQLWGYNENDSMGGYDPYSSSKACDELLITSYRNSFMNPDNYEEHGKSIASVRSGNVIGGGDWAEDRIIPDCIRSLEGKHEIKIRSPYSVRPWQHVLEALNGYLLLAQKISINPTSYCEAWNFGPYLESIVTVKSIAEELIELYGCGEIEDISSEKGFHESKLLNLDISKTVFRLGWKPKLNLHDALALTVDWYKRYRDEEVYNICIEHIKKYNSEDVM